MYCLTIEINDDGENTTVKMEGKGAATASERAYVATICAAMQSVFTSMAKKTGGEMPELKIIRQPKNE